jgi:uncharacterized DUF497 family protein
VLRPSQTDSEANVVYGKHEDKIWAVVINYNTSNVITIRRAREKERMIYEEEKGN